MRRNLYRATTLIAAAVMSLSVFFCSFAQAAGDVEYSKVGWWRVTYREVSEMTGCDARTEFQDQTRIQ